ncbi:hypothetical protein BCA33_18815 [Marinobacter sp. AC-23]|nr:hypothetical protein BCA33_18815 [Marinobacter sp. AC-23]
MHLWRAIGSPIPLVQLNNGAFEVVIVLSMTAQRAREPGIEAATRHTKETTQPFDAEPAPVLLDKRKNQ